MKRRINAAVAVVVLAALVLNTASTCAGWQFVGDTLGWCAIISGLWLVVDNKLKEREQ